MLKRMITLFVSVTMLFCFCITLPACAGTSKEPEHQIEMKSVPIYLGSPDAMDHFSLYFADGVKDLAYVDLFDWAEVMNSLIPDASGKFTGFKVSAEVTEDGKMVINENEANIVRFIFRSRLQGYSDTATANRLMELGVPAPYGGKKWSPTVVRHMLSNEKMKGDALIQKSYVADFLDKRQRKNKGEVQQYYVTGGHEAIIDSVLFDHVQEIVKVSIEDERGFSGVNPWSTKLVCGKCRNYFRIKHRHYKMCWECRDGYKKPDPCKNSYIYETARDWHVKEIMRTTLVERPDVVKIVSRIIDRVVKDEGRKERVKTAVAEFGRLPAEHLVTDDEDFLLAIKAIRFFPDYPVEAELVDGSRMEMELKPCWSEERKRRHQ